MTQVIATNESMSLRDIVDGVVSDLQGFVREQERSTWLTDDLEVSQSFISIPAGQRGAAGLVEVDFELIQVDKFDSTNGTLLIPPFGRGMNGSVETGHTTGAKLTFNPRFPRMAVVRAVNSTILSIGTSVPAVAKTTITSAFPTMAYEIPEEAQQILAVTAKTYGPSGAWVPLDRYTFDPAADVTQFPSGKSLTLLTPITPGVQITVSYAKAPSEMIYDYSMFPDTGLPSTCRDVLTYGACARLIAGVESAGLDYKSVSVDQLDNPNGVQGASSLSRYYYGLYRGRLQEEAQQFWTANQPRMRRTR